MPRAKQARRYTMYQIPPRVTWNVPVQITREAAAELCEQLHHTVSELGGAAFYYPEVDQNKTTCRYEFHHSLIKRGAEVRLGLILSLGSTEVTEIEAYATTPDHIESLSGVPEFDSVLLGEIQDAANSLLSNAWARCVPGGETPRHSVFHLEMPYGEGVENPVSIGNGHITVFPTRIIKDSNKRLSAVVISVPAASNEAAKIGSLRDLGLFCALATLTTGQHYAQAYPQASKRHKILQHLDNPALVDLDSIYPYRKTWPQLEPVDPAVGQRMGWIWDTFGTLASEDRKAFLPALFAYYAGCQRHRDFSTLSIVAYAAALSSLAMPNKRVCHGSLCCSQCGELKIQHNLVGEVAAITTTIKDALGLDDGQEIETRKLIDRVYRKQRSAYVHGAELRHEEYHQGGGLMAILPSADNPVQDLAYYQRDLMSIARIARRTLLNWLANRASRTLDKKLFQIDDSNIIVNIREGASVGLRGGIMAKIDHRLPAFVSKNVGDESGD